MSAARFEYDLDEDLRASAIHDSIDELQRLREENKRLREANSRQVAAPQGAKTEETWDNGQKAIHRVLDKAKRPLTDDEQKQIRVMLNEALEIGQRLCELVKDNFGEEGELFRDTLSETFAIIETSDAPPHELCISAEGILRHAWAMLGHEAAERGIKHVPWVIKARTDLHKMAAKIRYGLHMVGIHVPLYQESSL